MIKLMPLVRSCILFIYTCYRGTEIGKGITFGCQNQSGGKDFGWGTEILVTGPSAIGAWRDSSLRRVYVLQGILSMVGYTVIKQVN